MMADKIRSLYVDMPKFGEDISVDDFIVAIGKTKSNSVYHVVEVKIKESPKARMNRFDLKVYKSDLITAISRDEEQKLIPMVWYSRNKKQNG
jgi:hypothetical protein